MAKGLRMFHARNAAGGHLLTIAQIRTGQSLICADCGTSIVYSRAHQRGDGTQVAAYLRLAQGRDHGPDCKYNLRSQVEALAALGRSLDEATQPLRLLVDGKYLLRLGIPGDGPPASQRTDAATSTTDGKSIRQVWSGRILAPYCRTASGLARIAALVEHKPELENMVLIRHGDRRIDWSDFFFEKDEGARLVALLRSAAFEKNRYPVAVRVHPRKRVDGRTGAKRDCIQCEAEVTRRAHPKSLMVARIYGTPELLETIELGRDCIVFGAWSASPVPNPSADGKTLFENVSVNLYQAAQACSL